MTATGPRIGIDLRALVGEASGIGFFTLSILRRLAERQFGSYVGMSHGQVDDDGHLTRAGVALEPQGGTLGLWWQQVSLPRRLDRGDIDLLWSPLMTLPLRLPVPGVVTVHDMTAVLMPESHRAKLRWSILPFLKPTLRKARLICVDSLSTSSDLIEYFPDCRERVRLVYPAVDPEFRPGAPDDIAETRARLGCEEGYLLYSGTLEPRKNLGSLLDAWEVLHSNRPSTPPLVLTGPYGWHSRDLLARIRTLESRGVKYLGRLSRRRMIEVVQAATLFVYPSLYEGFGLPPAEAMACGIPTVSSNRSSLPEVIGNAGLLVDPDDSREIAKAISRILDQPSLAKDLSEKSRLHSAKFHWDRAAEEMERVFAEALQ